MQTVCTLLKKELLSISWSCCSILLLSARLDELETRKGSLKKKDVFSDVQNNWTREGIQYCYDNHLMGGTSATRFAPDKAMTRGMFTTVLWRMAGEPASQVQLPFTDLTQDYYKPAIAWAYENGVVGGVGNNRFAPDKPITREQVATILYRYAAKILKLNVSAQNDITGFPDYGDVSTYAQTPLSWANAVGVISGSGSAGSVRLLPGKAATRAQGAKILMVFDRDVMSE